MIPGKMSPSKKKKKKTVLKKVNLFLIYLQTTILAGLKAEMGS